MGGVKTGITSQSNTSNAKHEAQPNLTELSASFYYQRLFFIYTLGYRMCRTVNTQFSLLKLQ